MMIQPTAEGFLKKRSAHKNMRRRSANIKTQIASWERTVLLAVPPFTQVQHLIKKFGGIVPFAVAAGVHPTVIVRSWLASPFVSRKTKGARIPGFNVPTGGLVPSASLPKILLSARVFGILLTPQDLYPDFLGNKKPKTKDLDRWVKTIEKTEKMRQFEDALARGR